MAIFQFGKFKTEIDATDYTFQKTLETLYAKMEKQAAEIASEGKASEYISKYCKIVFLFFDGMFGNGTSDKMFGETRKNRACDDALFAFSTTIAKDMKQYRDSAKKRSKLLSDQMNAIAAKQK